MNEMMGQYNRTNVTNLDAKIQIQDLSAPIVTYSNDLIGSFESQSSKDMYQNTVISKPLKEEKSPKKLSSLESNLYRKSTEDIYQHFNVTNLSSSVPNLHSQEVDSFKVPQTTSQSSQGYKFQPPVTPNIKFSTKVYL